MPATNTLYVAEKPSVARDLAAYISKLEGNGGQYEKAGGFYAPTKSIRVTYPAGHIIETEFPDAYLTPEQSRSDPFTYLPLFPKPFKQHPRYERGDDRKPKMSGGKPVVDAQWKVLEQCVKWAKDIVNAGDVGREGQLIFDEILIHMGLDPAAPNVRRLAITDPSDEGLKAAFESMGMNSEAKWVNLRLAAQCRSEADWIVGMNASRAYQSVTGERRVGLGRVRTVVLALISDRCKEIENFKPVTFFTPKVTMKDGLVLRWKSRTGFEDTPGFNSDGQIIDRRLAESIVAAINAKADGRVVQSQSKKKSQSAPVGFSLTTLQAHISKKTGCSLEEVKNAAQRLYDKPLACITYVGTDCPYYPESMIAEARGMMRDLSPAFTKLMSGANPARQTVNFLSDAQIQKALKSAEPPEHYAIAPKGAAPNLNSLSDVERATYMAVVQRFAAQFYPDYEYQSTQVKVDWSDDHFEASATETLRLGWKEAEGLTEAVEEAEVDVVTGKPVSADVDDMNETMAPGE